jgi:replicative DNA helicase
VARGLNLFAGLEEHELADLRPPQNLQAEQVVLGSILIDGRAAEAAFGMVTEWDFYRDAHVRIFRSMLTVHRRMEPIDLITVTEELRRVGELETETGISAEYLTATIGEVVTAAHVKRYCQILKDLALLRSLAALAGRVAVECYRGPESSEAVLATAAAEIAELENHTFQRGAVQHFAELHHAEERVASLALELGDWENNRPHFGIPRIDRLMCGLPRPGLTVLKGRSSSGKTALAYQLLLHWAMDIEHREPTALFSLEMSLHEQTLPRLAKMACGVDVYEASRQGSMFTADVRAATQKVLEANVTHINAFRMSPSAILSQVRSMTRERDVSLVIVDYIQRVSFAGEGPSEASVRGLADALKNEAERLKLAIVAVSQVTVREDGTEVTKWAKAVEEVADAVVSIRRDGKTQVEQRGNPNAVVSLEKNRNGPVAQVPCRLGDDLRWTAIEEEREPPPVPVRDDGRRF